MSVSPALAQPDISKDRLIEVIRKAGIHASVGVRQPTDKDVTKGLTTGISIGLAPGQRTGWKFPVGISTYSEELNGPSGSQFANLSMMPVFAGVGYGWHRGKLSTSMALQGGYSFNKVSRAGVAGTAFAAGEPISIDVDNSFIVRPRLHFEYFLNDKLTLRTTFNYIVTNPNVEVITAAGRETGSWRANAFNAGVGIGFYPFRR